MAQDPLDPGTLDLEDAIRARHVVGYARTSTEDQVLDLQLDALRAAGCTSIHTDQLSGARTDRPGLAAALTELQPGDTLVVWRLDRLGRSLVHLADTVRALADRGVAFRSLTEHIDTSSAAGRLMLHMMGAFAEFERDLARERISAGMAAAKRRGQHVGRRHRLTPHQREEVRRMIAEGQTYGQVAKHFNVSPAVAWRVVNGSDDKRRRV